MVAMTVIASTRRVRGNLGSSREITEFIPSQDRDCFAFGSQ